MPGPRRDFALHSNAGMKGPEYDDAFQTPGMMPAPAWMGGPSTGVTAFGTKTGGLSAAQGPPLGQIESTDAPGGAPVSPWKKEYLASPNYANLAGQWEQGQRAIQQEQGWAERRLRQLLGATGGLHGGASLAGYGGLQAQTQSALGSLQTQLGGLHAAGLQEAEQKWRAREADAQSAALAYLDNFRTLTGRDPSESEARWLMEEYRLIFSLPSMSPEEKLARFQEAVSQMSNYQTQWDTAHAGAQEYAWYDPTTWGEETFAAPSKPKHLLG